MRAPGGCYASAVALPFKVVGVSQVQNPNAADELEDQLSVRVASTDKTRPFTGTVVVPQEGDFVAAVSAEVSRLLGGIEAIFSLG